MYLNRRYPRYELMASAAFASYLLAHEIGFRSTARLAGKRVRRSAGVLTAASPLPLVLLLTLLWERARWRGTLDEFEANTAADNL